MNLDSLSELIIRPPRTVPKEGDLGVSFSQDPPFERKEVVLTNARSLKLYCSWFHPPEDEDQKEPVAKRPVLVYAHGNASNRSSAITLRDFLLRMGLDLFCFDFAGCGQSEGEYISVGHFEKDDLKCVLDHVSALPSCGPIVVMGRSMGAASAMLYAQKYQGEHPLVRCLIFDGIFESLRALMTALAREMSPLLGLMSPIATPLVRRRVKDRAGFLVDDVDPLSAAGEVSPSLSGLFFLAKQDEMFPASQVRNVYGAYKGLVKSLVEIEGTHNDFRDVEFWDALEDFLVSQLTLAESVKRKRTPGELFAHVVPFMIQESEMQVDLSAVRSPLKALVGEDAVRFVTLWDEPTWCVKYTMLQGRELASGAMRFMLTPNSGLIIQTPRAETMWAQIDEMIGKIIRRDFMENLPLMQVRVRDAAHTLLDVKGATVDSVTDLITTEIFGEPHRRGSSPGKVRPNNITDEMLGKIREAVQDAADGIPQHIKMEDE